MTTIRLIAIYGLLDPRTNEVRYVGLSKSPVKRFKEHCSCSDGFTDKVLWIKELRRSGLRPTITVFEWVAEVDSERVETRWIHQLGKLFPLLNKAKTGRECRIIVNVTDKVA